MWSIISNHPKLKLGGLDWSMASNLHIHPANGKHRPAALTNKKQANSGQIHADNKVKRMGFSFTVRNMKMFIFWRGAHEKLQSMIQPIFRLIFLTMHANQVPIQLVTQSLY
jgi:hypothetical protein